MDYKDFRFDGSSMRDNAVLPMAEAFRADAQGVCVDDARTFVITGLTAYGVASSPALAQAIIFNKALFFGLIIAELALRIGVTAAINRLSMPMATLMFAIYSAINLLPHYP